MKVVVGPCPWHSEITDFFKIPPGHSVIFSWGDIIYNPGNGKITRELHQHEEAHGARQGSTDADIMMWWRRYMDDALFRIEEETIAHVAEYRAYCKRHGSGRPEFLNMVATRLSSSMYGNMLGFMQARDLIIKRAAHL